MTYTEMVMGSLLRQLPALIVYTFGIVLAVLFWRRCPRACLLALLGCAILAANSLAGAIVSVWFILPRKGPVGGDLQMVVDIQQIISIVRSLVHAGGFALVLAAVFSGRPRAEESSA